MAANSLTSKDSVDAKTLQELEEAFKKLSTSDAKSLLKKYLTKTVFDSIKNKKTIGGATLLDVIRSGVANLDSGVGVYAPDAAAYRVFGELFNPVVEDYHVGFKAADSQPPCEFGNVDSWIDLDPKNEFIVSTRIRCARSIDGFPLNPCMKEDDYVKLENNMKTALTGLAGDHKGTYYPLAGMGADVQKKLIDDHFLFKEGDRFLESANSNHYWPKGRGIFHNEKKTFLVWVNEEDHVRIISMQMGGNIKEVYQRLVGGVKTIEKAVKFSHDDRLGFLTFCPTNLGTTIRASVHIKVPKLAKNYAKLEEAAGKYNLQVRGTRGEHSAAEGGVYDISNKRRLGLSEFQAVEEMYKGILELIELEKKA